MEFKDISSEQFRIYTFPGGDTVRIDQPCELNVSASGGHRVTDATGRGHYIPAGFIHIEWAPVPGKTAISF